MATPTVDTSSWTDHQPTPAEPRSTSPVPDVPSVTAAATSEKVRVKTFSARKLVIPEGYFLSGFCTNGRKDNCRRCPQVIKNGSKAEHLFVTCVCDCHQVNEAAA
ncbi:MAG: hypothetical protein ACOH1Y_11485 [Propionicimonas sp.]